jgi:hypothetical protein
MPRMSVATLIAAFLADGHLHVARYVKSGSALGYCGGTSADQAVGIYHVPNWAFDGRPKHGDVDVCLLCSAAMGAIAEPE